MSSEKPPMKDTLHPRNCHREGYNFPGLIAACPELGDYIAENKYGITSLDFSHPRAVKLLNKMLLIKHYGIEFWDIPREALTPPVPSRAEYIHRVADLLGEENNGKVPTGPGIQVMDIGVGANLVYPIIGHHEYGWSFVGTDSNRSSLKAARKIVERNPVLGEDIQLRAQEDHRHIFKGVVNSKDLFDLCVCNPPFHASPEEAESSTRRKWKNLQKPHEGPVKRSFGGQSNELWYRGGEKAFLQKMVAESAFSANKFYWFTSLVSKGGNVTVVEYALQKAGAMDSKVIEMAYGNKISRVVCWTFLNAKQRKIWRETRW